MDVVLHVLFVILQLGGEHLDDALIGHFVAEFKRKNDVRQQPKSKTLRADSIFASTQCGGLLNVCISFFSSLFVHITACRVLT
jgi:hypothetical protein